MPEVILDGIGAGMTTAEYEKKRAIDCRIAEHLGWAPFSTVGLTWRTPNGFEVPRDCAWDASDQKEGVPWYSFEMNYAWRLIEHVTKVWSYLARQKFWENLQKRGGMDPITVTFPKYPEAFESLVSDMPEHIALAWLETADYHKQRGVSLVAQSPRAANFAGNCVKMEEYEDEQVLEDGTTRPVTRQRAVVDKAPWVH